MIRVGEASRVPDPIRRSRIASLERESLRRESRESRGGAEIPEHRRDSVLQQGFRDRQHPHITAQNTPTAPGTIALSRDLLRTFTAKAPFDFGDKVLIPGVGIFEVTDTMHPRWREKADIWFASIKQAKEWGCRTVFVTRVEDNAPTIAFSPNN